MQLRLQFLWQVLCPIVGMLLAECAAGSTGLEEQDPECNLDVVRGSDNSIRGRMTVVNSPLFTAGNVEAKIAARKVFGTISDDQGNHILPGLLPGGGGGPQDAPDEEAGGEAGRARRRLARWRPERPT